MKRVLLITACILLIAIPAQADLVTVNNYSFESPTLSGQGGFSVGDVTDWTVGGAGAAGVCWLSGQITDPNPVGAQDLYLNNAYASQTLSAVLTAGVTYTLTVAVGHRSDVNLAPYSIALLAGSNTLISGGSFDPGSGHWGDYTLSYTATAASPGLGNNLVIQISDSAVQAVFDNVRLDASPTAVPTPAAIWLLGSGLIGLIGIRRKFKK